MWIWIGPTRGHVGKVGYSKFFILTWYFFHSPSLSPPFKSSWNILHYIWNNISETNSCTFCSTYSGPRQNESGFGEKSGVLYQELNLGGGAGWSLRWKESGEDAGWLIISLCVLEDRGDWGVCAETKQFQCYIGMVLERS